MAPERLHSCQEGEYVQGVSTQLLLEIAQSISGVQNGGYVV